jgi:DNA-binding NtrC family response regulator
MKRASIAAAPTLPDPDRMPNDLSPERSTAPKDGGADAQADRPVLRDLLISFEKNLITAAMSAAGGNQKRAAEVLGLLPTTLQEKLKRFGLVNPRPGRRGRAGERAPVPDESPAPHSEAHQTPMEDVHK